MDRTTGNVASSISAPARGPCVLPFCLEKMAGSGGGEEREIKETRPFPRRVKKSIRNFAGEKCYLSIFRQFRLYARAGKRCSGEERIKELLRRFRSSRTLKREIKVVRSYRGHRGNFRSEQFRKFCRRARERREHDRDREAREPISTKE